MILFNLIFSPGDLLYLYVLTLEDKKYHITASTRGFYVNQ